MMTVTVHPTEEVLRTVTEYFPLIKEDEWFEDQLVKDMVLDVDQTTLVGTQMAMSPYFGSMPNSDLSGGVKGLIMIYKYPDEREYSSVIFGDNCVKWLCKLSFFY